jgi:hypothetical protein
MMVNTTAVTDDRAFDRWENEGGKVSPSPSVNASQVYEVAEVFE